MKIFEWAREQYQRREVAVAYRATRIEEVFKSGENLTAWFNNVLEKRRDRVAEDAAEIFCDAVLNGRQRLFDAARVDLQTHSPTAQEELERFFWLVQMLVNEYNQ